MRLIDADALKEKAYTSYECMSQPDKVVSVDDIDEAPTVDPFSEIERIVHDLSIGNCYSMPGFFKRDGDYVVIETKYFKGYAQALDDVLNELKKRGYSGDAVNVVRCADCRHYGVSNETVMDGKYKRCAINGAWHTGSWYCASGERKEDEAGETTP